MNHALLTLALLTIAHTTTGQRILRDNTPNFGRHLDLGDRNRDGVDDLLIGSPYPRSGAVHIVDLTTIRINAANFGQDVAWIGDIDQDGYSDAVVGAAQRVRVLSGKNGKDLLTITHTAGGFGQICSAVGDVDRDGRPDFAVSAPADSSGPQLSGSVFLYSGKTGKLIRKIIGTIWFGAFGRQVAPAGDLNSDGYPDLFVSEAGISVHCVSTKDGKRLHTWTGPTLSGFGAGLAAGDVDGDGSSELLVQGFASAFLYSSKTGKELYRFAANGIVASCIGNDMDGDGHRDVFLGIPSAHSLAGTVRVYSGRTGKSLGEIRGNGTRAFGTSLAGSKSSLAIGARGEVHFFDLRWRLPQKIRPTVSAFGRSCGSLPRVTLHSTLPRVGANAVLQVKNLKPPTAGMLVFGVSSTRWQGIALPFDLGALGFSGCNMLASWDVAVPFREYFRNSWSLSLKVPAPFHRHFFAQAWVLDRKANAGGVATTNALRLRTGN